MLISGNVAVALAAIDIGVDFFAGYPITPSSEIAEELSFRLPASGGKFIQMEDEIAAMAAVIGASLAGARAMTATSGPGFSLKQENIGYACMTEVPCVIVNVMRGGPSTGLPTLTSQGDVMQARWGTHGDHPIIALVPHSVQDTYFQTVNAFNFAEKYRVPVVLLLDEVIGHMNERVELPPREELNVVYRKMPDVPPEKFIPYKNTKELVNPMPPFGSGYRYHVTGLCYDETGFPTNDTAKIAKLLDRLQSKMVKFSPELEQTESNNAEDCDILLVSYGSVFRSSKTAVKIARENGKNIGIVCLTTLWPFPYETLRRLAAGKKAVIVAEQNLGMISEELMKCTSYDRVHHIGRADGEILSPPQIVDKIMEVYDAAGL